jgi:subtilisin family serine protease
MWGKRTQPGRRYRNFLDDTAVADQLGTEPWTKAKVDELIRQLRQRRGDSPQDDTGHGTHVAGIIMQLYPEANLYIGRVLAENVINEEEATRAAARRLALVGLHIMYSHRLFGFRLTYLRRSYLLLKCGK